MAEASVLLVTGGSRGIGAAVARLAAARGYNVAVNYRSDAKAAAEVVAHIKAAGRKALAVQGDMSREDDVERVFAEVDRGLGALTHLVYNSGVTGAPSRVDALDAAVLRHTFEVNVFGAFYCVQAAIRRMSTKHGGKGGSVVLVSSIASTLGAGGEYVWYAASKGAVDSMTVGLSRELAGEGIRVNAVAPGLIETEIHEAGRLERLAPTVPIGRVGRAQEVAEPVLFLLSEAASYTTGAIVRVSGAR